MDPRTFPDPIDWVISRYRKLVPRAGEDRRDPRLMWVETIRTLGVAVQIVRDYSDDERLSALPRRPENPWPAESRAQTMRDHEGDEEGSDFRSILDCVDAVVWVADPATHRHRYVNRRVEGVFGISAELWLLDPQARGRNVYPADRAIVDRRDRCVQQGEEDQFDYRVFRADGRLAWLRETISVGRAADDAPLVVRGWICPIERPRKPGAGASSKKKALVQRLDDASYLDEWIDRLAGLSDPERIASEALSGVLAILGAEAGTLNFYDPEKGELATVASQGLGPPDGVPPGHRADEGPCGKAIRLRRPVVVDLEEGPTDGRLDGAAAADGRRLALCVPLIGKDRAEVLGTVCARFPGRHRPSRRQLLLVRRYTRLAAWAIESARLARAARESIGAQDEFLATLAHELRTPLAAVHNFAQILRPEMIDAEGLGETREALLRHARHMARMVEDLFDASRIARGKLDVRKERIDLRDVVARAVEDTRPLMLAKGHQFRASLPGGPIELDADPIRLEQVLVNLLSNAARYTPPGGNVGLEARCDAREVTIRICDDGIGMTAEARASVFGLFQQADAPVEGGRAGLGIGLALVKSLVESHGGSVAVASDGPGRGSEFVVTLPRGEGRPTTSIPSQAGSRRGDGVPSAERPSRVLLVDDEPDATRALARLLRHWGHEVRVACDAEAALREARVGAPQVVLLDLGMPGADGLEIGRRLREDLGPARFIALTGQDRDEDRRRVHEAGWESYLVKPVDLDALRRLLGHSPSEGGD